MESGFYDTKTELTHCEFCPSVLVKGSHKTSPVSRGGEVDFTFQLEEPRSLQEWKMLDHIFKNTLCLMICTIEQASELVTSLETLHI